MRVSVDNVKESPLWGKSRYRSCFFCFPITAWETLQSHDSNNNQVNNTYLLILSCVPAIEIELRVLSFTYHNNPV